MQRSQHRFGFIRCQPGTAVTVRVVMDDGITLYFADQFPQAIRGMEVGSLLPGAGVDSGAFGDNFAVEPLPVHMVLRLGGGAALRDAPLDAVALGVIGVVDAPGGGFHAFQAVSTRFRRFSLFQW